jgi:hypothetical protein
MLIISQCLGVILKTMETWKWKKTKGQWEERDGSIEAQESAHHPMHTSDNNLTVRLMELFGNCGAYWRLMASRGSLGH